MTVYIKEGRHLLLADDAEQGAGAPVGQVVIAALELDGAQIGQHHGAVIGVGGHHVFGYPAVLVQKHDEFDGGFAQPAGQLIENVHVLRGGIHLFAAALLYLRADVLMYVLHGKVLLAVQESQRLCALVGELLFHHESGRYLVALIEIAVDDETVQLRPQRDGFQQRRHDQVEHGVRKARFRLILPGQIRIDRGQVDALGDVRLVIAAVGIDNAGDEVEGIQFTQQPSVPAVASSAFFLFHMCMLLLFHSVGIDMPITNHSVL